MKSVSIAGKESGKKIIGYFCISAVIPNHIMDKKRIRLFVLTSAISLAGIMAIQLLVIRTAIIYQKKQFESSVMTAMKSVASQLNEMQVKAALESLKSSSQLQDAKLNNLTSLLQSSIPKQLVKNEFNALGIRLDFHIGVFHAATRSFLHNDNPEFYNAILGAPHSLTVTCVFDEEEEYRLAVYFPRQHKAITRNMLPWIILLFALTVVLVWNFRNMLKIFAEHKKLSDIKSDFVNNVTHEFKTPIASISLAAELLTLPEVQSNLSQVRQYSKIISEESNRLKRRVDQVLYLSSFREKILQFNPNPVDIHNVLKSSLKNYHFLLRNRKAKVIRRFDAAKAITMGDAEQLEIVFGNLIDNAVKYSPGPPEITIETKVGDGRLIVVIADKGIGISKEYQQEIFREFYRVRTGDRHVVKGFGLGLYYVKTVVETHNGSISVKSYPGKGSSFEVVFPAATN